MNTSGKQKIMANMQNILPLLGLVFVVGLFAVLTKGRNLEFTNIKRVTMQSVLLMIGTIGAVFTISHGSIDFSLGGILGMSIAIGGLAGMINPMLVFPVILIVAVLGQLFVVLIHMALNIPSFVVSLAMMFITKGVLVGISQTVSVNIDPVFFDWDKPILYFGVLFVVLIAAYVLFEFTKIGKYNKAIGSNYTAAVTSGIAVNKYKILAYVVCGSALGVSGFLNFIRAGSISATTGSGYEFNVLISLVLGGTSITGGTGTKVRNAIVGCLILMSLDNGLVMMGVQPAMMGLIKGVIFLVAIALAYDRKTGQIVA